MKKIFFSDKIKTLFFVGFLIIFAFFLFNQKASAETYFSEDFESYNLGDGDSVLRYSDNWFYNTTWSWFGGIISNSWYSSPNQSYSFDDSPVLLGSKPLDVAISSGSLYFTAKLPYTTHKYGSSYVSFHKNNPSEQVNNNSYSIYAFNYVINTDDGLLYIDNPETNTAVASYPLTANSEYHFQVDFNFITKKFSLYINNDLLLDNVNFFKTPQFTSIKSFKIRNYPTVRPYTDYFIDDIYLTDGSNPFTFNLPVCGSDAGKLIETTPVNLCDSGTAGTVSFDGSKWSWDCISGVVSQSCRAYLATTEPVDGTCGAWNGETFNTWPPLAELCELRTSLVIPSMVETINGYTWTCSGINGGTSDYCYGNKTSPPLMPELPAGSLDDCSGLSILEGIVCNIGNTLKTIFLPSSEKINELNQTVNKMSSKFPFSYISKATETFNELKGNITETSILELSIMESEKRSIDFSTIAFFDYIKMLTTILIIIVFSFWLIRFIKHIF